MAGGTGDIAFRFVEAVRASPLYHPLMRNPNELSTKGYQVTNILIFLNEKSPYKASKVVVCDYNPSMIEVGKDRAKQHGYTEDSGEFSLPICAKFLYRPFTQLGCR